MAIQPKSPPLAVTKGGLTRKEHEVLPHQESMSWQERQALLAEVHAETETYPLEESIEFIGERKYNELCRH